MSDPRTLSNKPKELVDKNSIAEGEIELSHLSPGLFDQIRKLGIHGHEGITSKKLTQSAFINPPTRYVPITPVQVVNTDPSTTAWNDSDISAYVTSRTFAVACRVGFRGTAGGETLYVRVNGGAEAQDDTTGVSRVQSAGTVVRDSFMVETDTDQIYEWSVSATTADIVRISIIGYFERIS